MSILIKIILSTEKSSPVKWLQHVLCLFCSLKKRMKANLIDYFSVSSITCIDGSVRYTFGINLLSPQ